MYTYGLIIELSRNEKLQKYKIILSQHTKYLHNWLVPFLTYLLLTCLFFFLQDSYMCKPRTTFCLILRAGLPGLAFWFRTSIPSWLGIVNGDWLDSMWSEIFLPIKFIILQVCPIKQAAFLLRQPTPHIQLLIQSLLVVPKCYFT